MDDYGWSSYDEATIAALRAAGHGTGTLRAYKPWLTVRDGKSHGLSTRTKGWKTDRVHHVLSNLELYYLYCLEWSREVTDIREQFPLPLEKTLDIADRLGCGHPTHPQNRRPVVMTTDFLVTVLWHGRTFYEARAVKPSDKLADRRVLEKLDVERIYWTEQGINWGIVTEREYDETMALNIDMIHEQWHQASYISKLTPEEFREAATLLTREVLHSTAPLRRHTSYCDRTLGLEAGMSLTIAYHLIARRQWQVDMYTKIDPTKPINLRVAHLAQDA